jgi:hypothetical protein
MLAGMASPSRKIRNLNGPTVKHFVGSIQTAAVSYCGADPDRTSEVVWSECLEQAKRFFADVTVDEILEAFRLAAAGQYPDVNLAAYRGQMTATIFCEVLAAYTTDRNKVKIAVDKVLGQWTQDNLKDAVERKNELARMQVVKDFKELRDKVAAGKTPVPDVEEIRLFWFDFLKDTGLLDLPREVKVVLWDKALDLVKIDLSKPSDRYEANTFRALFKQLEAGTIPNTVQGKREAKYKRLIIQKALCQPVTPGSDRTDQKNFFSE